MRTASNIVFGFGLFGQNVKPNTKFAFDYT